MSTTRSLLAASLVLALAGTAHASVVYDNLAAGSGNYFALSSSSGVGYAGEQFIANSSGDVANVDLMIAGDNTNTGGSVMVTLYDDAGGPDNLVATLGTIADTSLPDGYARTLYDIPADVSGLTPGSPYWIVMQDTSDPTADAGIYGGTSIVWFTATSDGGIGVSGGNYVGTDGGVYSNSDQTFGPGIMCVTSSSDDTCPAVPVPTPEPAGIGILAIAMAGLGFARWGRGRAS